MIHSRVDRMDEVDVGTIIGIMAGTFALTATVIGILVRQLLSAYKDRTQEQLNTIKTEYGEKLQSFGRALESVGEDRVQCETRETHSFSHIESLVEKLRDQWLEFQRADAAMEATRGRRLDAMFNVLDHQKDELRSIKPAVLQRQEELHKQGLEELRRDLRAYVRDLVKEGRIDG